MKHIMTNCKQKKINIVKAQYLFLKILDNKTQGLKLQQMYTEARDQIFLNYINLIVDIKIKLVILRKQFPINNLGKNKSLNHLMLIIKTK